MYKLKVLYMQAFLIYGPKGTSYACFFSRQFRVPNPPTVIFFILLGKVAHIDIDTGNYIK